MTFHHPSGRNVPDPDEVSASDVVRAGHRGELDLVARAVDNGDPAIRAVALSALLRLERLDIDRWQEFAADSDSGVRRRAAELAPRLAEPGRTEHDLVRLLGDADEIAEVAAFSLGEVGSSTEGPLEAASIQALERTVREHGDALCREAAVAALGALESGLDTILHACQDKATVRRRAIIALAPFDGPEVTAALHTALDDRDWQVRQAAEDLLAIGEEGDEENGEPDDDGTEP